MSIDDPNTSSSPPSADALQQKASQELGQAVEQAEHDLNAIGQKAKDDVQALRDEAGAKVEEVTEKAKSFGNEQKDLAANQINGVASAITKVADELESTEQPIVARYARDLASGLTSMGKTIEGRDVDDLMALAQDFGRKQPLAFLGAAALAGFVASRFALASTHRHESKSASGAGESNTYGSSSYGQSGSSSIPGGSQGNPGYGSASYGQGGSTSYPSSTSSQGGSATSTTYGQNSEGNS